MTLSSLKSPSNRTVLHLKTGVFLICLFPLGQLVIAGFSDELGADPVKTLTSVTGTWALNFLFITLAVTPLRQFTGWLWLVRLRRTLGLYTFFYASLHFSVYLVFDQFFDWAAIAKDITKRPWITAGFFSFVLLIPLAATSTDGMIRRLGGRHWRNLHRLVYLIAVGGVFHYLWLVKRDITNPAAYGLLLCLLLYARTVVRTPVRTPANPLPPVGIGGGMSSSSAARRNQK